jgi:predicted dehydrogenase
MKIGIVGFGHISKHYFAAARCLDDFEIVAVCDINNNAFRSISENVVCYSDIRDLLRDRNVEAVVVSVPTLLHYEVGKIVIDAGKPLMLEKPATTDRRSFDTLETIACAAGVPTVSLFHYVRADEVVAATECVTSTLEQSYISWHSSFYDPYNADLNLYNYPLVNAWIDSGINELSVFMTLCPGATLKLDHAMFTPRAGENMGTIGAIAAFEIAGSVQGTAVFEVNWAVGLDRKVTRIHTSMPNKLIEMDHSEESLRVEGDRDARQFSTGLHRLTNHYIKLFPWAVSQIKRGKSNWDFARKVHEPFFDVLELVEFTSIN